MNKELLIIFTRNPELGKVKTRLAAGIGDEKALKVYNYLLRHTIKITKQLSVVKEVHYSEKISEDDTWPEHIYNKKLQFGTDLGLRMMHALNEGFKKGFENIIIIGSDIYDLDETNLKRAFKKLEASEVVIGPAQDGGYYLLGLKKMIPQLFQNKKWGTNSVLNDTLADLITYNYTLLEERNDIDTLEDLNQFEDLKALIKLN